MFRNRAHLVWRLLTEYRMPAYAALDFYMEAMRDPDRYTAAGHIVSARARQLRAEMPPGGMPVCRRLAGRFANCVEDWSLMTAEPHLTKLKLVVHMILTHERDYRPVVPAARAWNDWLPRAEEFHRAARELDGWRDLPPPPRPAVKPKRRRRSWQRRRDLTPSLFDFGA